MAIDKILVLVELTESGPTATSLELLTAARGLASTVEAASWGPGPRRLRGRRRSPRVRRVGLCADALLRRHDRRRLAHAVGPVRGRQRRAAQQRVVHYPGPIVV
ncbi:MAG: hypothetical protein WCL38_08145, partial [Actinomycetota bacterium]